MSLKKNPNENKIIAYYYTILISIIMHEHETCFLEIHLSVFNPEFSTICHKARQLSPGIYH